MALSPYSLLFNDACSDGEHHADAHDERRLRQEGDRSGGSDGRAKTPDTGAAEGTYTVPPYDLWLSYTAYEYITTADSTAGERIRSMGRSLHKICFSKPVTEFHTRFVPQFLCHHWRSVANFDANIQYVRLMSFHT